ncbi:hypothetical protein DFJ58DRAFT_848373 [Suillus subalutaceus]|uniref:uncharacterized protein n=1 Tax=Suillus subalutaceus TaxID=48586 RepID=UPI001B883766|nr:uncharacterized protein DFJ58DRAFT_848373 [Suillus subalutaceus]KAG1830937.1 hypothetical protein DFJ58DRAFT_848373 [Suillus subalutaceus]
MSSDESKTEDYGLPVFRLKTMLWRADFSHELKIIDEQRLAGAAVFTPRGSKPAKRLHNAKRESVRPAVAGLPRSFYNLSWLSGQRPSFKRAPSLIKIHIKLAQSLKLSMSQLDTLLAFQQVNLMRVHGRLQYIKNCSEGKQSANFF